MSSMSPKIPIPIPHLGVLHNINPRVIGPTGLKRSYNWIFRDGTFRVRDGLVPIFGVTNARNLLDKDAVVQPTDHPFTITLYNFMNVANNDPDPQIQALDPDLPFRSFWNLWGQYDGSAGDWDSNFPTWVAGDPSYLNHWSTYWNVDCGMVHIVGRFVELASPVVEITQRNYGVRIDPIVENPGLTQEFVRIRVEGWLVEENPNWNGTDPEDKFIWNKVSEGTTAEGYFGFENPPSPLYAYLNNLDGAANAMLMVVEWLPDSLSSRFTPAQLMFFEGSSTVTFQWPSTYLPSGGYLEIGQRPVSFVQFKVTNDNTETVCAVVDTGGTNAAGWYRLLPDFSWELITGSEFTDATAYTQTVYRVFEQDTGTSGQRYLLGVNYLDPSIAWDGASDAVPIEEPTDLDNIKARCIAVSYNRVLYGNVKEPVFDDSSGADAVLWTAALKFDVWDQATTDAGYARLADTPGEIISMMEMGNQQTAIYKEDAIYIATATGQTPPFRFDMKQANIVGPASPLSVVALDDSLHAYLASNGDVVIFDGVRTRSAGLHIQSYIKENINFERMMQTFGFFDKIRKELYFFFPAANSEDGFNCVMINTTQGDSGNYSLWPLRWQRDVTAAGFTEIDLSVTVDQLSGTIDQLRGIIDGWIELLPKMVMMTSTGVASELYGNTDWDGPIEALLETGTFDLGELGRWKTVKYIDHLFKAGKDQTMEVWLIKSSYGREEENTNRIRVPMDHFGPKKSGHRQSARLFSMAMSGSFSEYVEWYGSEACVELRGNR